MSRPEWLARVITRLPDEQLCRSLVAQAEDSVGVEEGATWPYLWPGGLRLAADLPALLPHYYADAGKARPQRVLDLGCGRGLLGFAALELGCPQVTCVDGDACAIQAIQQQAATLGLDGLRTACQAWDERPISGGPFDCILAGDVLYRPQFHRHLLRNVAAQLAPQGQAFLSDPRQVLEPHLESLAQEVGLRWQHELRPGPYSLCRLKWA